MYDLTDYITSGALAIISIGILIICICCGYLIVKKANNPIIYNTQTINGNIPTLTIKGI